MTPTHDDGRLDAALRALKADEARAHVPDRVERALLQAWDRHAGRRGMRAGARFRFGRAVAVAAGVLLVVTVFLPRLGRELAQPALVPPGIATPAPDVTPLGQPALSELSGAHEAIAPAAEPSPVLASREESATLVLLGEPIATGESVRVVRMRVPGATLAELGIRSISTSREQTVDLDVIVGEDGVARALRVGM